MKLQYIGYDVSFSLTISFCLINKSMYVYDGRIKKSTEHVVYTFSID